MPLHAQITEFYLPVGVGYPALLLDYQDKNGQLSATIEVTPSVWESIDLIMMFNLTWNNRNEGSVSGKKPLEIAMMFSKDLYQEMKSSGTLLTDSAAFLAAGKNHPMKSTKNWYITSVTEEIELPSDLKTKGTVRQGFTTIWKKEFE